MRKHRCLEFPPFLRSLQSLPSPFVDSSTSTTLRGQILFHGEASFLARDNIFTGKSSGNAAPAGSVSSPGGTIARQNNRGPSDLEPKFIAGWEYFGWMAGIAVRNVDMTHRLERVERLSGDVATTLPPTELGLEKEL